MFASFPVGLIAAALSSPASPSHDNLATAEAREVATLIAAYTASIRSLNWTTTIYFRDKDSGERKPLTASWELIDTAQRYRSERAQFAYRGLRREFAPTFTSFILREEGVWMTGFDSFNALLRDVPPVERQSGPTMLTILGYGVDGMDMIDTVGEALLQAKDLRLVSADGDDRTIEGTVPFSERLVTAIATFDVRRGAIRRLEYRDISLLNPVFVYEVTEFTSLHGVALPRRAHGDYFSAEIPEADLPELLPLLRPRGENTAFDPTNPAELEPIRSWVRTRYGPGGVPVRPLGLGRQEAEYSVFWVNAPVHPNSFAVPSLVGFQTYDAMQGSYIDPREPAARRPIPEFPGEDKPN